MLPSADSDDPRQVYSLIYGEAILNDAVAIVAFNVFKEVVETDTPGTPTEVLLHGLGSFVRLSLGSMLCGVAVGALVTLFFKYHGGDPPVIHPKKKESLAAFLGFNEDGTLLDKEKETEKGEEKELTEEERNEEKKEEFQHEEHKRHQGMADASVFFFASLFSYFVAEAFHVSGIICNQFGASQQRQQQQHQQRQLVHARTAVQHSSVCHLFAALCNLNGTVASLQPFGTYRTLQGSTLRHSTSRLARSATTS